MKVIINFFLILGFAGALPAIPVSGVSPLWFPHGNTVNKTVQNTNK
jgi:hypothetical protein